MTTQSFADGPDGLASREELLGQSGLDFMRGILQGRIAMAPIAQGTCIRLTEVEDGRVVFQGRPEFRHCNPVGAVHGGWYGTLLDSALGCAAMTKVPKGSVYTTLEYKVNITRALPVGTEVQAEARVVHAGRSTAVAEGWIRGLGDGRLYATGSTTCIIMAMT